MSAKKNVKNLSMPSKKTIHFGRIRRDDGNIILGSAAVIQVDCRQISSLGITMNPVEILVD
jgi:hypothetical protein